MSSRLPSLPIATTANPCGLGVRHALGDRCPHRFVDRAVGEIRQQRGDLFERHLAGKVAERDRQRQAVPLPPQRRLDAVSLGGKCELGRGRPAALDERFADIGPGPERFAQERRKARCPVDRMLAGAAVDSIAHPIVSLPQFMPQRNFPGVLVVSYPNEV